MNFDLFPFPPFAMILRSELNIRDNASSTSSGNLLSLCVFGCITLLTDLVLMIKRGGVSQIPLSWAPSFRSILRLCPLQILSSTFWVLLCSTFL